MTRGKGKKFRAGITKVFALKLQNQQNCDKIYYVCVSMNMEETAMADKNNKKKKKKQSTLEAQIFSIMEKSLKTAVDMALDDIFKDWK